MIRNPQPHFTAAFGDRMGASVRLKRGFVSPAKTRQVFQHHFRERAFEHRAISMTPIAESNTKLVEQFTRRQAETPLMTAKFNTSACDKLPADAFDTVIEHEPLATAPTVTRYEPAVPTDCTLTTTTSVAAI